MHYATLEELQAAIEKESKDRPSFNLQTNIDPNYVNAYSLAQNQDDKNLILKISRGGVYLSDKDKASLWTVTNPQKVSEILSSAREKTMGGEACKNIKTNYDKWGRPSDINSLDYYVCPGDDPSISLTRENNVTRLAYPNNLVYETNVPYGLTSMNSYTAKQIPQGLKM